MRVTIVVGAIDSSGGFRVVATLGRLLMARGHQVCIVTRKPASVNWRKRVKARLTGIKIQAKPNPAVYMQSVPGGPVAHPGPLVAADLPDADIVIGTWWQTMEFITTLPMAKGLPIHLVQDYEIWPPNDARQVDRVLKIPCPKIAISGFLHDLLTQQFGNQQVFLLPNAIDHDVFYAPPRQKRPQATVGFTYSYDPRKGSDLVVKAVTRAREICPNLRVLAFGHTPPREAIPVPEWVEFHVLPAQEAIRELYAQCDAWLFGSRREGFGLPILEAMACRTPVIGMPAGAAPDLLTHGCGILVGDQDWAAMAKAIVEVAAMPAAEWLALSDRAHARAEENQWPVIGEKLETILSDMLSGKSGSAQASNTA